MCVGAEAEVLECVLSGLGVEGRISLGVAQIRSNVIVIGHIKSQCSEISFVNVW